MNQNILQPLCDNIRLFADRNAFFISNTYYTYRQFGERIASIRYVIREMNDEGQVWALAIHDDIDTYASIFALWMEGKAYVPLHPYQPLERNLNIVCQVGCKYILDSEKESVFSLPKESSLVFCTAALPNRSEGLDEWTNVNDEALAYILFTSGSTGVPKGVQISRCNIASFMDSFWQTGISIEPEDRCLQAFDLTFDVSIQSFLVALTRGACVYTLPYGQVKYHHIASLIQKQRITFGAMAPSMLSYLRPYFSEFDASSMKTCILTAEACFVDLLEDWFQCAKNTEIYDFYGPTEATIYSTCYKLTRGGEIFSHNSIVSIGKPLANVKAIIIREDGSMVEGEERGELCLAGSQVTPGYWNNLEKNATSFFEFKGVRYYHTGDLCYWDESGNIMYSGRIDQQAKIQGFRVELGEIEHHACEFYCGTCRVAAIAFQNTKNLTEIALFVETQKEDAKLLVEYLRSKMPPYMIPSRIIFEPQFPLNKSEKIDKNALKQKLG